uniref:Uncharacterized protein n=1 Tax=Arundo donax TaxID=35708 RepID=A0A0A8Z1L5_ARUDO
MHNTNLKIWNILIFFVTNSDWYFIILHIV